jgi:hypothetical protein
MITVKVGGDGEYPGFHFLGILDAMDVFGHPQPGVLKQVFRLAGAAREIADVSVNGMLVHFVHGLKIP